MKRFASYLGMLLIVNGIFDLLSPATASRFWKEGPGSALGPFASVAEDLSHLSSGKLRYLAGVQLLAGALLYWFSTSPREREVARPQEHQESGY